MSEVESLPSLAVVIPTYGRAHALGALLEALRTQTVAPHEIVVVDQNQPGWLRAELGDALAGARTERLAVPNACTARNYGFARTSADVVLFIDDDLLPEPTFVARALARLAALGDVGCLSPTLVTDADSASRFLELVGAKRRRVHPRTPALWEVTDTLSAAMFFRRATFVRSGGFDELLFAYSRTGEDHELGLRMVRRGLATWVDTSLEIFHDESVPGGCELRTGRYWEVRERALKSLVLCARLHGHGALGPRAGLRLLRSAFLNRALLQRGPRWGLGNARLLVDAVRDSRRFLREHGAKDVDVLTTDYVTKHEREDHVREQA